jgi:hypothetical protein
MDELFETLLTLVPIALIIALRVAASKKKKAESAERGKLQAFLAARMKAPPSAAQPIIPKPTIVEAPGFAESATPAGDAALSPVDAGPMVAGSASPAGAPSLPVDGTRPAPKAAARPAAGFPASLDYLSPLRRAVVLAEVLGPPKGL